MMYKQLASVPTFLKISTKLCLCDTDKYTETSKQAAMCAKLDKGLKLSKESK